MNIISVLTVSVHSGILLAQNLIHSVLLSFMFHLLILIFAKYKGYHGNEFRSFRLLTEKKVILRKLKLRGNKRAGRYMASIIN